MTKNQNNQQRISVLFAKKIKGTASSKESYELYLRINREIK